MRQEAARQLVFALRAAFETPYAMRDAEFQRLVIRRFEMQAGDLVRHGLADALPTSRSQAVGPISAREEMIRVR